MHLTLEVVLRRLLICLTACIFIPGCVQEKETGNFRITLQNRSFTPEAGSDSLLNQVAKSKSATTYGMLQFKNKLSINDHKLLNESGIVINGYLGDNAYNVSIRSNADLGAESLEKLIRWGGLFKVVDKMNARLAGKRYHDWAIDSVTGKLKLFIQFYPDVDKQSALDILDDLGLQGSPSGPLNSWSVLVDPVEIERIASYNAVRFVQEGPIDFFPLNAGSRRLVGTDEAQQQTYATAQPAYGKVSGNGVRIGICDTGIDHLHNDFSTINANGTAGVSRIYNNRTGSGSHGTHVASITAGNGFNSINNGFPGFHLRGQSPQAGLGDYPSFGSNAQAFHDAIATDGTDVTNHSYVQTFEPEYDVTAQELDEIVRGAATDTNGNAIPAAPQVWAAGNNGIGAQYGNEEGYYAVFTSAKNTLSVGAMDTGNTRLSDFSSLGPTFDGRIKPDIMAPGCGNSITNIGIAAASNNTQGYTNMCGTSMAAPVVSGIIGLMMEQYNTTFGTFPALYPSTYKAILVQTARDVIKTSNYSSDDFNNPDTGEPVLDHAGPDFSTGYGLVDAENSRALIGNSSQWREAVINATGDTKKWCVRVADGEKNIKVVMAWDDEPGDPALADTASHLVNDLDLVLVSPDGTRHYPWILEPLPLTANPGDGSADPITTSAIKAARKGRDRRNNIEMVTVCTPKSGTWEIHVSAYNLPNGNAQPFSLASSHDISPFCRNIFDICARYPWICEKRFVQPIYIPEERIIVIDPLSPVFIDKICLYVLNCPGCGGAGWSYCPGWEMNIRGLPPEAIINVIDQSGNVIFNDETGKADRILKIGKYLPGNEPMMIITDAKGNAYQHPLKLQIDIKRLQ